MGADRIITGEGRTARDGAEIGIAEGYATAATVHQALGIPVARGIDAGNLLPVSKALRQRYPASSMLIAADNDLGLTRRIPPLPNVRQEKAEVAAVEVGGGVTSPLSDGVSVDWNDH